MGNRLMRGFAGMGLLTALMGCLANQAATRPAAEPEWTQLFNGKDLAGWYQFYTKAGKADPGGYVKVEDGMIHVLGLPAGAGPVENGYLASDNTFGDCHLRIEYKWGTKRFAPHATTARDSGILYLFSGTDKVWPSCMEFQVAEGVTGDVWVLNNAYNIQTTVRSATDRQKVYMPATAGGVPVTMTTGFLQRSEQDESLTDWNTLEIILAGNTTRQIVNGKTVLQVSGIVTRNGGTPVTQGKIGFQVQGAEMWVRKVEVRPGS
jgi:hypothetical protein